MLGIILNLLIGGVAGWLAGNIMKSHGSIIRNVILGVVGGAIASALLGLIGISFGGIIGGLIVSVIGACACIYVGKLIFK